MLTYLFFFAEEQFLVIHNYGVQYTSPRSHFPLFTARTRFISRARILDILIHEAFIGFRVTFILVVLEADAPEMTVVFRDLEPRKDVIEIVWRKTRECFYGSK
jgi:phosphatidylinositol glycan class H protein